MHQHSFKVGDKVRCQVTGDYALAMEVTGAIQSLWQDKKIKIKTPLGHVYLVHAEDCEAI